MSNSTTYNRVQYVHRRSGLNRNQNSTRFTSSIKLGPVTHTVLVALMITVLGLIYLTQAIKATSYDYQTQEIDGQISQLKEEKLDLEVENAKLTALNAVRDSSVAKAMVKSEAPSYVNN